MRNKQVKQMIKSLYKTYQDVKVISFNKHGVVVLDEDSNVNPCGWSYYDLGVVSLTANQLKGK